MRKAQRARIYKLIEAERERQDRKWGPQRWPIKPDDSRFNHTALFEFSELITKAHCESATEAGRLTWYEVLSEEVAEVFAAKTPQDQLSELVQAIAVAVHMVEQLLEDREIEERR